MWMKQCQKPPHTWWPIAPMKMMLFGGMVYHLFLFTLVHVCACECVQENTYANWFTACVYIPVHVCFFSLYVETEYVYIHIYIYIYICACRDILKVLHMSAGHGLGVPLRQKTSEGQVFFWDDDTLCVWTGCPGVCLKFTSGTEVIRNRWQLSKDGSMQIPRRFTDHSGLPSCVSPHLALEHHRIHEAKPYLQLVDFLLRHFLSRRATNKKWDFGRWYVDRKVMSLSSPSPPLAIG